MKSNEDDEYDMPEVSVSYGDHVDVLRVEDGWWTIRKSDGNTGRACFFSLIAPVIYVLNASGLVVPASYLRVSKEGCTRRARALYPCKVTCSASTTATLTRVARQPERRV